MSQEFYTSNFSIEGSLQTTEDIVTMSNFVSGSQNLSNLFVDTQSYNSLNTTVQNNSAGWGGQTSGILEGLSGSWQSTYTDFSAQSANNASVYSNVNANSATYATIGFADSKFFALSGGLISGPTRINGNVTIFGDLTSTGTQTFANTIFSTTSSLSVVHVGSGPAVWIGNNGSGDIASFNDTDQGVEVFHIGGANGDFPNVGVKIGSPNKDFTVKGEISATGDIWTTGRILSGGQELLSLIQPSIEAIYSTVNANSSTNWNYQGTDLKSLSASWTGGNAAFTNLVSNSALYLSATDLSFLSVSANWNSVYSTVLANSSTNWNYHGTDLKNLSAGWVGGNAAFTNLVANSAAYLSSVDLSFLSVSADWNSVYNSVASASANWDSVYSNVASNSASFVTINFANSKFFALSGGLISGETRINGNVTIFGDLSSTGTQTFANTIFATTSSLSVVHVGSGPAVWVGNNGSGDIASFYAIYLGVSVLHIG